MYLASGSKILLSLGIVLLSCILSTNAIECIECKDSGKCKSKPSSVTGRCFSRIGCHTFHRIDSNTETFSRGCTEHSHRHCFDLQDEEVDYTCKNMTCTDLLEFNNCANQLRDESLMKFSSNVHTYTTATFCSCSDMNLCNDQPLEKVASGGQSIIGEKKGITITAVIVILAQLKYL